MKYFVIAISLLSLVGLFYWFQWRPSQARKECVLFVKERASDREVTNATNAQFAYNFCLHNKGL